MPIVRMSPRALTAIDKLAARLGEEYNTSRNPLFLDISASVARLQRFPHLGIAGRYRGKSVRYVLLKRPWHLYYSYDEASDVLEIIDIRYARRGSRRTER